MTHEEQLKKIAKQKGIKLKDLAEKSGVSERVLSYAFNGHRSLTTENARKIAEAMDCVWVLLEKEMFNR